MDADGFLTDLESGRIRKHTGNIDQVDELFDILVTKDNKDFDHFCVILEEGYHVWSEKLREAAGLGKWQQLDGMEILVTLCFLAMLCMIGFVNSVEISNSVMLHAVGVHRAMFIV